MRVRVQTWGNSLAVRIPKPFAADADVGEGSELDLEVSEGRLVATPVRRRRLSLRRLLSRVTSKNVHRGVDFGPPVGREARRRPFGRAALTPRRGRSR
jgi:antitoxin MazE